MIDTQLFRIKILSLALRGKLTKQLSSDSDVKMLADEIRKRNGNIYAIEKIENIPYEIPSSWCWMRVSEFGILSSGKPYEELPSGVLYVKVGDMNLPGNEKTITTSQHYVSNNNSGMIPVNSIIFPKRGGAIATNKKRSVLNSPIFIDLNTMALTVNYAQIFPFVKLWFDSLDLAELQTGTSIPQINNKDIYPLIMPLPPLEEQKRIVDIVEKAFGILDEIAIIQEQYSANLEVLKSKIIDAGIQGKLTEQLPEDGTAEELLKQIVDCQNNMIKASKIKKPKDIKNIDIEDIPFEIPNTWKWEKWGNIINVVSARRVHQSDWRKEGIPFYRAREIAKLAVDGSVENDLFISQELYDEFSRDRVPQPGDLMVSAVGTLGKSYVVKDGDLFYYKDASVLCFENYGGMNPYYLRYVMQSSLMKNQIESNSGGTTVDTLTMVRMVQYILPIPPLNEQDRIVSKINEILEIL